jgi:hypothetical protein
VSSDGHPSPTQLRARPGPPAVDAAGHRLEDGPAFGEPSGAAEDGRIPSDDFREFTFANAVRFWGTGNHGCIEGTAVANAAAAVLEGRDA